MSHHRFVVPVVAVVFAAAGVAGGIWWSNRSMGHGVAASATPAAAPAKKVLYWHDPMVPGEKFDKPGKSPFMDMELVPVYADEEPAASGVKVSPQLAQNLGVRTAIAERGRLARSVDVVGAIAFDERAVSVVQARTAAFVEQLLVRAPLDPVRRGQPLARLFVPEWAGAQQEYLAMKASPVEGAAEIARAARNRLLLLGMTEDQVQAVDREGKPVTRVTIVSPADGVVGELGAREGMNVVSGAMLFRINGVATVWVNLDVPEAMAGVVRPGAALEATVPAYPGETFKGNVAAVLPDVNAATRTVRARAQLDNPGAKLKPGMFAAVRIQDSRGKASDVVLVPSEAVIVTGERSVVIADRGEGRFEPVPVKIGAEEGGRTEVLEGLRGGEKVVASGQFLIDSEASLRGVERRMDRSASPATAAPAQHAAEGKVERVAGDTATISHGPVPSLNWPAMTMEFKVAAPMATQLKAGETIHFEFVKTPAGEYQVTGVHRMGVKP